MSGDFVPLACILAIAAVIVLRVSWGRPARSRTLNAWGWCLGAGALAFGWAAAGAWGASVATLFAMGAAVALLAQAAASSSKAKERASNRRAGMLPQRGEPLRLGQRFLTFTMVAVLPMFASAAVSVCTRWLAVLAGAEEANANVIGLFAMPVAWTILAFLILMTESRRRQFTMLAISTCLALPAVLTGLSS